jgi:regulator of protease activity HflC (stomatin/prohibitin superfamily)
MVTMGKASNETLNPGFTAHAPYFQTVQKYSIVPKEYDVAIDIADNGAISSDNQIIGARTVLYWKYDDTKIPEIAKNWSADRIEQMLKVTAINAIKAVIGTYTIFDLAPNQEKMGTQIEEIVKKNVAQSHIPVNITQVSLTNFDWSKEFDAQIQETMNKAQQVRQAEQELAITKQQTQKQVVEAQAALDAAKLNAEATVTTATAQAKANELMTEGKNFDYQKAKWQYDIDLARAQRWNGVDTTTYVPLTAAGAVVTMPATTGK